jgi:hypothetical protein
MSYVDHFPRVDEIIPQTDVTSERVVGDRRERERLRKKKLRKRQTSEQRKRERLRKREGRKRQTHAQREREKERGRRRRRMKIRPFMALDGEGGGTDELGRQNYLLMVASGAGQPHILHRNGKPLSVRDCLEFILALPADPIKVGYGFGYDVTQILRGIKERTLRQILDPRQGKNGPCYTYWGDYAIIYQQGQYLRVARVGRGGARSRQ